MIFVRFTPTVAEVEEFRRARPPRDVGLTPRRIIFWGSAVCMLAFMAISQCWFASKDAAPPPPPTQTQWENSRETFIGTLPYIPLAILPLFVFFVLLPRLRRSVSQLPHPALYRTQQAGFT